MTGASELPADLEALAAAHGVATSYQDQLRRRIDVARDSIVAVLGALGVDASSDAAVASELERVHARPAAPPVVVLRESETVTLPLTARTIVAENGAETRPEAEAGATIIRGAALGLGWHTLYSDEATIPLVVAPDRLMLPAGRHWGWMLQLYAAPSRASWGVGDLADLRTLAEWTGERGGSLALVNPLHAVAPNPPLQPSPYYPASRRWTNPLYLRVEATEAYRAADADTRAAVDALRADVALPSGPDSRIDRDSAWSAKRRALELLWPWASVELAGLPGDLVDFATWCALAEAHGNDWRSWPEALRRPDSPAVEAARRELADRVAFHAWLQLLCDAQLDAAQQAARAAGMPIGIVHDLAVGTDPAGADAWALQDALALGARIGAPPDTFNQQGQDWGMPPWHPRRLAELGYAPLRDMLRSLLRHAGGVRIDHVLGLFRMWWVPEGGSAKDGTYVSYDANALLGVVTLEAARAGAIVIGEDLGTVTPGVRRELADRGVLGTSVLWFERDSPRDGKPGALVPPAKWRENATATVSTHDLPTAAGWLHGEHVRVRAELDLLDDPAAEERGWRRERAELVELLRAEGLLAADAADDESLLAALHAALARTPCRVVLAAPGDVLGDRRQPNLPGTTDEYPNWRLPLADETGRPVALDDVLGDARIERLAAELRRGVR